MNKFQIFWTKIRKALVKIHLFNSRCFYRLTFGMFQKGLFSMSVPVTKLKTDVKILDEDKESVTLARCRDDGSIIRGEFKIISTSDMHLEDDPALRRKSIQMLANNIVESKPDLVVFTGDMIQSKFQLIDAIQFAQFMENLGVYWCIVFGNHETREERGLYKYMLLDFMSDFKHCLVRFGPEELYGYGNYCVKILNGEDSLQQVLFLFDSGRDIRAEYRAEHGVPEDLNGYDFLKNSQINWYKNKIGQLKEQYGDFKSLMYMHIPLPEYREIIEDSGTSAHVLHEFKPGIKVLYGKAYENIGCSSFNSGMFEAILEMGSTQAIFSGHDHINDFAAIYKGVTLVYSQCCGYETYTLADELKLPEKEWQHGVTVTVINSDGTIKLAQRLNRKYLKEVIAQKQKAQQNSKKKKK